MVSYHTGARMDPAEYAEVSTTVGRDRKWCGGTLQAESGHTASTAARSSERSSSWRQRPIRVSSHREETQGIPGHIDSQ